MSVEATEAYGKSSQISISETRAEVGRRLIALHTIPKADKIFEFLELRIGHSFAGRKDKSFQNRTVNRLSSHTWSIVFKNLV